MSAEAADSSASAATKQGGPPTTDEAPKPTRARRSRARKKPASAKASTAKDKESGEPLPVASADPATADSGSGEPAPKAKPKRPRKKAASTGTSRRRSGAKAKTTDAAPPAEDAAKESDGAAAASSTKLTAAKSSTPRKRTRKKKESTEAPADEARAGEKKTETKPKKRAPRKRSAKKKTETPAAESTTEPTAAAKTEAKPRTRKKASSRKTDKADAPKAKKTSRSRGSRTATKREPAPDVRKEMIISVDVGEQRVAVIEDDTVVEVYLERRGGRSVAGSIYKGVVDNVLPGMEASFVDIGLERNGFLYVGEIVMPELEDGGKKRGRRIQDLISRGQEVLVQAVKDPMGTKGARLTTEISLPGRFVVFVPYGEGIGISRRLDDDERERLKKLCKGLDLPEGGIIVRTAAEGASQAELEGDLALLRKLWATILGRSNRAEAPTLVYREAELPLRLVRDLFIRDFGRLVVDHEQTHRRLVGYLKRTSPELAARVELDAAAESIMQRHGVDKALRSTLSRHVPLPSGGSLVFDYAEALTVVDVNTGRFVGAKGSKTSLEDTITANNLEAAREVVRQLRLRDIGGIIVIDFIDMANSRNRKAVEQELGRELARDRTKTYVVEISPLGLVEMTRQNVTDGPREILTVECPTCAGDGIVLSEESIVIGVERALRSRALASSAEGLLVELHERIARRVIGPGGDRLAEFESDVGRRVFVESRDDVPVDHFEVLAEGTSAEMEHRGLPVSPGEELELELEDVYLLDEADAIGRRDGYVVVVAGAGSRVGKKIQVVIDRVTRTVAYASMQAGLADERPPEMLTAEAAIGVDGAIGELDEVELPAVASASAPADGAEPEDPPDDEADGAADSESEAQPAAKRRRRRRSSKKKTGTVASEGDAPEVAAPANGDAPDAGNSAESDNSGESDKPATPKRRRRRSSSRTKAAAATDGDLDAAAAESKDADSEPTPAPKKRSSRKKKPVSKADDAAKKPESKASTEAETATAANGAAPAKSRRRRRRSSPPKAAGTAGSEGGGESPATAKPANTAQRADAVAASTSAVTAGDTTDAAPKKPSRRSRSTARRRRARSGGSSADGPSSAGRDTSGASDGSNGSEGQL